jgi:hypothetical protein
VAPPLLGQVGFADGGAYEIRSIAQFLLDKTGVSPLTDDTPVDLFPRQLLKRHDPLQPQHVL